MVADRGNGLEQAEAGTGFSTKDFGYGSLDTHLAGSKLNTIANLMADLTSDWKSTAGKMIIYYLKELVNA